MTNKRLSGKVALVTGGTSGIGRATVQQFVAEGATVFVTGRRQDMLDETVKLAGPGAIGIQGDVSVMADLDRIFAEISKQSGTLDIVFANAGLGDFMHLADITEAHFDHIFNVNVKGTLFTVQKALPLLKDGMKLIKTAANHGDIYAKIHLAAEFGCYGEQNRAKDLLQRLDKLTDSKRAHNEIASILTAGFTQVCAEFESPDFAFMYLQD